MADEAELTPKNIDAINRDFYAGSPWTYFQQRLCHLMLVATHDERLRQALADGVTVEGITLRVDSPEVPDMALQGGSQRFELALDDWKLISRDGAQVSWIADGHGAIRSDQHVGPEVDGFCRRAPASR